MPKKTKHRKTKARKHKLNPPPRHKFISKKTGMLPETKKPLIIAVISIAAILVLSLLILFAPRFVGKAFFAPELINAGIEDPGTINENTDFTVHVAANIGDAETVAIAFALNSPGLTCTDVTSNLGWIQANGAVLAAAECTVNGAIFEYATLDYTSAKTAKIDIAEITFDGTPADTYDLEFTSFDIIDLETSEPVENLTIRQPSIIVGAVAPAVLSSVEGVKIELEELPMTRVGDLLTFNTKLTAKEDLTSFEVITQLEDAVTPGVVLLYKKETVDAMTADETRTIQTVYQLKEGVTQIKKKVFVYDQLPGDTLGCDKLEHIHTIS